MVWYGTGQQQHCGLGEAWLGKATCDAQRDYLVCTRHAEADTYSLGAQRDVQAATGSGDKAGRTARCMREREGKRKNCPQSPDSSGRETQSRSREQRNAVFENDGSGPGGGTA